MGPPERRGSGGGCTAEGSEGESVVPSGLGLSRVSGEWRVACGREAGEAPSFAGQQIPEARGDGSRMRFLKNATRWEAPTLLRLIETALRIPTLKRLGYCRLARPGQR